MALVVGRESIEPDASRPPLVVTVGRDDDGHWNMSLQVGGLPPVVVAALLTEAAATVANEAGAMGARMVLTTCAQAFWSMSPPEFNGQPGTQCPGCGEVH